MSTRHTHRLKPRTTFHINVIWHRSSEWAGSSGRLVLRRVYKLFGAAGRWCWTQLREQITLFRVITTLIGIPTVWYVYREAVRDVIVIDSITAPKRYEDLGYSSSIITLRIAEKLEQIERTIIVSRSNIDRLLQPGETDVPEIEVPATKLSLKTVVQILQQILHHEPEHVRGEITFPWSRTEDAR